MPLGLRRIDRAFGPNLQDDTENLRMQMLSGDDPTQKESNASEDPVPDEENPTRGRNQEQELHDSVELLRRVH